MLKQPTKVEGFLPSLRLINSKPKLIPDWISKLALITSKTAANKVLLIFGFLLIQCLNPIWYNVVKRGIFCKEINGKYEISFVLDDRNHVVDMWRKGLGLTCLQVNYDDF